jgi:hypothetical protein
MAHQSAFTSRYANMSLWICHRPSVGIRELDSLQLSQEYPEDGDDLGGAFGRFHLDGGDFPVGTPSQDDGVLLWNYRFSIPVEFHFIGAGISVVAINKISFGAHVDVL